MAEKCFNCRFAKADADYCVACRRYPPKRIDDRDAVFPVVSLDEWCGEWQPKKREEWSLS